LKSVSWIRRAVAIAALLAGVDVAGLLWKMREPFDPLDRLETSIEVEYRARQVVDRVLLDNERPDAADIIAIERDLAAFVSGPGKTPDRSIDTSGPFDELPGELPADSFVETPADSSIEAETDAVSLYAAWSRLEIALQTYSIAGDGDVSAARQLEDRLDEFRDAIVERRTELRGAIDANRALENRLTLSLAIASLGVSLATYILLERWLGGLNQIAADSRARLDSVGASIARQERVVSDQATSVAEITQMLDKLSAASQESSEQASIAASHSQEITKLTATGATEMTQTSEAIAEMEGQSIAISRQALQLRERATEVGQIALLVEELAMRTNTLSLNAGIEAVRAGRSGAGFQAIAQEIRDLSVQSQQAAQRIGSLSEYIQSATDETVHTSQMGIEQVGVSTRSIADTNTTFTNIQAAVDKVNETSHRLAFNAYEQLWPVQQLVEAMEALNTNARQTETNATTLASDLSDLEMSFSDIQASFGQRSQASGASGSPAAPTEA